LADRLEHGEGSSAFVNISETILYLAKKALKMRAIDARRIKNKQDALERRFRR
jgi:hypothetical protein